jgi:multiple antibiotic resistance protein
VAVYSLVVLLISLWAGSFILSFFGVSIAALRCAGGLVIAMNAWALLNSPGQEAVAVPDDPRAIAFYPLTMPLTAGPGAISVAIALSSEHPRFLGSIGSFFVGMSVATLATAVMTWAIYRASHHVIRLFGEGGNRIFTRLIAFVLLCIGIQVLITGLQAVFGLSVR